jgi:hypothetical protein
MEHDWEKVDEMVLALLYLAVTEQGQRGARVEVARLARAGPAARQGVHFGPEEQGEVGGAEPGGSEAGTGAIRAAL